MTETNMVTINPEEEKYEEISKDTLIKVFYFIEDKEEEISRLFEEERKRMYRLRHLLENAWIFAKNPDIKESEVEEQLLNAYEESVNTGDEEAYVYDEQEKNLIQSLRDNLQGLKDHFITPFVKHVRVDIPEKVNEFVKGTWGHLHASYTKAKEEGLFKSYAWKGVDYAPVSDFTTDPSFEQEVVGGPTKVYINDELHALDHGNDLVVYDSPDINKAMLDLEKIYKEDGLQFISLEKGMSVETVRNYLVAATLLKQSDINIKCIIADKTLRDEVLTPEFVNDLNEIENTNGKGGQGNAPALPQPQNELEIDKEALDSAINYVDYLKEEKLLKDSLESGIGYVDYLEEEKLLKKGLENGIGYVDYLKEEKLLKDSLESAVGYAEYLKNEKEEANLPSTDDEPSKADKSDDNAPKYDYDKAWEKTEAQINKRWERSTAMPESAPVNIYDVPEEPSKADDTDDNAPKYDYDKAWEKTVAQINKRWERSSAMPESAPVNIYDVPEETSVNTSDNDENVAPSGAEASVWDDKKKKSVADSVRKTVKKEFAKNLDEGYLTNNGQEDVITKFEQDSLNCFSGAWEVAKQIIDDSQEKLSAKDVYKKAYDFVNVPSRQSYEKASFLEKILEEKQKQRTL